MGCKVGKEPEVKCPPLPTPQQNERSDAMEETDQQRTVTMHHRTNLSTLSEQPQQSNMAAEGEDGQADTVRAAYGGGGGGSVSIMEGGDVDDEDAAADAGTVSASAIVLSIEQNVAGHPRSGKWVSGEGEDLTACLPVRGGQAAAAGGGVVAEERNIYGDETVAAAGAKSAVSYSKSSANAMDDYTVTVTATASATASTRSRGSVRNLDQVEVWEVGNTISGIYQIVSILGQGGEGTVFKVRHLKWGREIAVKRPLAATDLGNEAKVWTKLSLHPNVVQCYYVRKFEDKVHVFTEYVDGSNDLKKWISGGKLYTSLPSFEERSKRVSIVSRILDVSIQLCWGLGHAHQHGLVHQDFKPANVLVTSDGIAKVTDFGLATVGTSTQDDSTAGSKSHGMGTRNGVESAQEPTDGSPGHHEDHARVNQPKINGHDSPCVTPITVPFAGGTIKYWSPEQHYAYQLLRSDTSDSEIIPDVTQGADVWCWAVTVLEMFVSKTCWSTGPDAADFLRKFHESSPSLDDANSESVSESTFVSSGYLSWMPSDLLDLLLQCFALNPLHRPLSFMWISERLIEMYESVTSLSYFRELPSTAKMVAGSLNNLALSALDLGEKDAAFDWWKQALDQDPFHEDSLYNYHTLRWADGIELDSSVKRVISSFPGSFSRPDVMLLHGLVELQRANLPKAIMTLSSVVESVCAEELRNEASKWLSVAQGLPAAPPSYALTDNADFPSSNQWQKAVWSPNGSHVTLLTDQVSSIKAAMVLLQIDVTQSSTVWKTFFPHGTDIASAAVDVTSDRLILLYRNWSLHSYSLTEVSKSCNSIPASIAHVQLSGRAQDVLSSLLVFTTVVKHESPDECKPFGPLKDVGLIIHTKSGRVHLIDSRFLSSNRTGVNSASQSELLPESLAYTLDLETGDLLYDVHVATHYEGLFALKMQAGLCVYRPDGSLVMSDSLRDSFVQVTQTSHISVRERPKDRCAFVAVATSAHVSYLRVDYERESMQNLFLLSKGACPIPHVYLSSCLNWVVFESPASQQTSSFITLARIIKTGPNHNCKLYSERSWEFNSIPIMLDVQSSDQDGRCVIVRAVLTNGSIHTWHHEAHFEPGTVSAPGQLSHPELLSHGDIQTARAQYLSLCERAKKALFVEENVQKCLSLLREARSLSGMASGQEAVNIWDSLLTMTNKSNQPIVRTLSIESVKFEANYSQFKGINLESCVTALGPEISILAPCLQLFVFDNRTQEIIYFAQTTYENQTGFDPEWQYMAFLCADVNDSKQFVVGTTNSVFLIDVSNPSMVRKVKCKGLEGTVGSVAMNQTADIVFGYAGAPGAAAIWRIKNGIACDPVFIDHNRCTTSDFTSSKAKIYGTARNGEFLFTSQGSSMTQWDLADYSIARVIQFPTVVNAFVVDSSVSGLLTICQSTPAVTVWNLENGQPINQLVVRELQDMDLIQAQYLAISPDSRFAIQLLASTSQTILVCWHLQTGELIRLVRSSTPYRNIRFSTDPSRIYVKTSTGLCSWRVLYDLDLFSSGHNPRRLWHFGTCQIQDEPTRDKLLQQYKSKDRAAIAANPILSRDDFVAQCIQKLPEEFRHESIPYMLQGILSLFYDYFVVRCNMPEDQAYNKVHDMRAMYANMQLLEPILDSLYNMWYRQ